MAFNDGVKSAPIAYIGLVSVIVTFIVVMVLQVMFFGEQDEMVAADQASQGPPAALADLTAKQLTVLTRRETGRSRAGRGDHRYFAGDGTGRAGTRGRQNARGGGRAAVAGSQLPLRPAGAASRRPAKTRPLAETTGARRRTARGRDSPAAEPAPALEKKDAVLFVESGIMSAANASRSSSRSPSRRACWRRVMLFGWLAGCRRVCPLATAHAQRKEAPPKDLLEVGVTEHLNEQIPLDLAFVDSKGQPVTLAEYFDGQRPVILTLNYSNCPMLCSLQLDGLFDGLKKVKWNLGDQYRMVTVSIDPKESPERAAMTRDKYLRLYGREGVGGGYAFLTGKNEQIKKLADTVGFHYRYVPETGEYVACRRDHDLHARRAIVALPGRCRI